MPAACSFVPLSCRLIIGTANIDDSFSMKNYPVVAFWNCRLIGGAFQTLSQTNICLESQVKHQTRVH